MKVVKCLEHIPEDLWGRVVEDGFLQTRFNKFLGYDLKEFNIKQSDTFPLPEQGDKVEVSEDGVKWYDNDCVYVANYKKVFIINEPIVQFASANYIRPIEAKEESNDTNSLKHLTTDNKVMTTVGRNYRIELKIEHELVYDKHDDGTFTPVINMDVKDVSLIPIKTDKS